jgi:sulfate adenylyltransferase
MMGHEQLYGLVPPHGGALVDRLLRDEEAAEARGRAESLRAVRLDRRELADLEMIATGALSPLVGFMTRSEYLSVLRNMRLRSGLVWTLPVTLAVATEEAASIREGEQIALAAPSGERLALMEVAERFTYDRLLEAERCYGTAETAHPGVRRLMGQGEVYLGGPVRLFARPAPEFPDARLDPRATRRIFAERGWQRVAGFQTRNPVHRAHEYIQKCALEICDGLLLHPLVGETKEDDLPAPVRMEAYRVLLARYFPPERTLLAVFPAAMRYAGPREAVWHAICRKNYGCTHFIVGRDHAGVGNYYGTYDAQRIFSDFRPEELGITPLFFENSFYCRSCGNMATAKTCPHPAVEHLTLSGTRVREMLRAGEVPPAAFTRPEVAEVLIRGLSG